MIGNTQRKALSEIFHANPRHVNYLINWSPQEKIIYVETPKVGCTTIKQILQYAEYGYDMTKMPVNDHDHVHDRGRSPLKAPNFDEELFLDCLESPDYFVFTFARNPFSRILSAYLDKIVGKPGATNKVQKQMGIDPAVYIPTFDEFTEIVSRQRPVEMNPHWAPQTFLQAIDQVQYDFIGRFEFFEESIRQFVEKTKLQIPEGAFGLGRGHATSADKRLQEHYTVAAIERVREIYKEDFRRLGYGWSL